VEPAGERDGDPLDAGGALAAAHPDDQTAVAGVGVADHGQVLDVEADELGGPQPHRRSRNIDHAEGLVQLTTRHRWETAPTTAVGVARALYLPLRHDHQLWLAAPDQFVNADTITSAALLAS
jgi:hypothetical protein